MIQKLREAMEYRDSNYKLANIVELDDAFFGSSDVGGRIITHRQYNMNSQLNNTNIPIQNFKLAKNKRNK